MTDHFDIVERLNNVTPDQGWAVVNKKTEGIVIWFSKFKTLNARREALAFMGENPHYAETHEIREYTNPCIEHEAAAEITRLREDNKKLSDKAEALRKDADLWRSLYRRALNEANGLTNYVEDRPELRSSEKRLAKIEEEARAAIATQPAKTSAQGEPSSCRLTECKNKPRCGFCKDWDSMGI